MTSSSSVATRRRRSYGFPTNASDAVDAPTIGRDDSPDALLDVAVEYTFPASDPIAVEDAYKSRIRRKK
ncbi:MAG TPA: hypothetical protein VKE95_20750 [Burkholderiales bacterium]|nr:hypothetical protein [Burkholderiales bacterium]